MFRSNVFPVKSGFSRAGKKKGRGKKKKKMVDGSLARRRFNDSQPRYFALFVRVYAACPVARNTKKSRHLAPVRNNSRQRPIFYFPFEKTTKRHANISRKNAATLPTKDLSSSARKKKMSIRAAAEMQMFEGNLYSHSPLR